MLVFVWTGCYVKVVVVIGEGSEWECALQGEWSTGLGVWGMGV